MSMSYGDYFESGVTSDCCGASVTIDSMCSDCHDHCEMVPDDEYEEKSAFGKCLSEVTDKQTQTEHKYKD